MNAQDKVLTLRKQDDLVLRITDVRFTLVDRLRIVIESPNLPYHIRNFIFFYVM